MSIIAVSLLVAIVIVDGILGSIFRAKLTSQIKATTGADLHTRIALYLPPRGVSLYGVRITKTQPGKQLQELFVASRVVIKLARAPKGGLLAIRTLDIAGAEFSMEKYGKDTMAKIGGRLAFHVDAVLPDRDWHQATYVGDVELSGGQLESTRLNIDNAIAKLRVEKSAGSAGFVITLANFSASGGNTRLTVTDGTFNLDADKQKWELAKVAGRLDINGGIAALDRANLRGRLVFTGEASGPTHVPKDASALSVIQHEFIAYPRDVSIQPTKFPIAIAKINGGPISFRGGVVRFENLIGNYGGDQILLDEAHITLDDFRQNIAMSDLHQAIRIEGISGTLICRQPGPDYPAGLGKVIAQLHPSGVFAIGGGSWYEINRPMPHASEKPKPDWFFRVSTAGGAFAITDRRVPLTDIHGDSTISPMLVDISELRGNFLGGTVIAGGKVTPIQPIHYDMTATFFNVNLATAAGDLQLREKKPIVGLMYLKTHVWGDGTGGPIPPIQSLTATGEFEIVKGNFGEISTIRAASTNVTTPDQSLDGEAAGFFGISDGKVTLSDCVVGNPNFGLQGSGSIGFDKSLDLHAVAAPLGDWQVNLKKSKVPVLEDVGSDIAGAIQGLFAGAQRSLLWDVHICGTTTAPKVVQTPAPIITHSVAAIFGQLMRGSKGTRLIDQMRPADSAPASRAK